MWITTSLFFIIVCLWDREGLEQALDYVLCDSVFGDQATNNSVTTANLSNWISVDSHRIEMSSSNEGI